MDGCADFVGDSTSEVYGDPEVHPPPESYWGRVDDLIEGMLRMMDSPKGFFGPVRGSPARRVLLSRTMKHVYYRYSQERDELIVLAVWGAPRGRGPKL